MEFIPYDSFTEIQQKIIDYKLQDPLLTWKKWMIRCKEDLNIQFAPLSLLRFIKKTALGYQWKPEERTGGRDPFLCHRDILQLKTIAQEKIHNGSNFIELDEFLDIVIEIKTTRLILASKFLKFINCKKISSTFSNDTDLEPTRQWINLVLEKLGLTLETPQEIEEHRWENCSKNLIKHFFTIHRELIEACPAPLLFGADETMLKSIMKGKVLTTKEHDKILRKESDIPHITAMCSHNVLGEGLPLFIILPNSIQNLPTELNDFSNSGLALFASSSSGWMNAELFRVWCLCFINWLSLYRLKLPESIRNTRALLVLDGHPSRECPSALELMRRSGVNVLVLPSHTTHITQMFDICLAAPMKKCFSKTMIKLMKNATLNNSTIIAKLRHAAIEAVITAWKGTCTFTLCKKAAAKAGYYPFDEEAAARSKYAIEHTAAEDEAFLHRRQVRTRLDINGRVINTPEFINTIADNVRDSPLIGHLAILPEANIPWQLICSSVCRKNLPNKSFFLSRIPPCVLGNGKYLVFD